MPSSSSTKTPGSSNTPKSPPRPPASTSSNSIPSQNCPACSSGLRHTDDHLCVLKGHDFSRAANSPEMSRALATEGCFSTTQLLFEPCINDVASGDLH